MRTKSYISNKLNKSSGYIARKVDGNYLYKIKEKIRGINISIRTTGLIKTFSFIFFSRMYKQKMVKAFCCIDDNQERFFLSKKNLVGIRPYYSEIDLLDMYEIDLEEYLAFGKPVVYLNNKYDFKNVFLLNFISFIYKLRYRKRIFPCALYGSGKFTAGVVLPKIIEGKGFINFVRESYGDSYKILSDAYGLNIKNQKETINTNFTNLFITTSPHMHVQDLKEAISSGYKKIYCEKPAGISYGDLEELQEIAKNDQINIVYGFNRRFAPSISLLKKDLDSKFDLKWHTNYFVRLAEFSESMSRFKKGGGTTICAACHYLDLLIFLHGPVESFDVQNLLVKEVIEIDGYSFVVNIKHINKSTSSLTFIKASPGYRGNAVESIISSNKFDEYKIVDFKSILKNGKLLEKIKKDNKGWGKMISSFLEGKNNKQIANINDAITNLKLCLEIDKSISKNIR